jgi:hypothetical protein
VRSALDLGARPAPVRPDSTVPYVPGAVLAVRVEAVAAGFAPQLHVAEDVDLVLRLHAAGWRMRYDPAVAVAHQHRTAPWSWLARKAYYGTGAAVLAAGGARPGQRAAAAGVGSAPALVAGNRAGLHRLAPAAACSGGGHGGRGCGGPGPVGAW